MNERIEKLMDQSLNVNWYGFLDKDCVGQFTRSDLKKFAKMIVKECLQQCEQVRDDAYTQKKSEFLTESGRLIYEGVFGGATNCGFAIQQHFGVEE